MAERWINQVELADITGFHVKSLQMMYRREPGVLVTRPDGNKLEYKLPDCIINLLKREREAGIRKKSEKKISASKSDLFERKLEAETRMAEIELEETLGGLIRLDDHEKRLDTICERVAAALNVIPSKYLSRIQVARTELEAQEVGERIKEDTKAALFGIADDLENEPPETDVEEVGVV
jgi:phage terminase Nu1 subunit (DNA packaging protein)